MSLILKPDDERLTWQGVVSLERTEEWVKPWRIPYEQFDLFPPEGIGGHGATAAGVRITFRSNSATVAGELEFSTPAPVHEPARIDLCADGKLLQTIELDQQGTFHFEHLPTGQKSIELWLPQQHEFRLQQLELDDGATVAPFEDHQPRWITYGSSITQCSGAASPSQTWPAIVARRRGLNLTCMGFGGQCHLEPMLARLIRDLPVDYLSVCAGINILGGCSLSLRTFRPAIIGFVQIVREKHPDTPLAVISPIYAPQYETAKNPVELNLRIMRQEVAAAVDTLQAHGDRHIHYIDGLRLFGPDISNWDDLVPDGLHPNADGYKALAEHFLKKVAPKLFV